MAAKQEHKQEVKVINEDRLKMIKDTFAVGVTS